SDLTVYTTADPVLQHLAQAEISRTLENEGAAKGATQGAVVLMKEDGAVKALVGGADYRQSEYNRATNALRQPGSAFKLFVYLAAFEVGLNPGSKMRDSPFILEGWQPSNYTDRYEGTMTLRDAFAKSINTIAAKLGERADRTRVINMAERLGITSPIVRQPSTALGTSEVRLIELVSAYGVLARNGLSVKPYGISRIETPDGTTIYEHTGTADRLLPPRVVRNMRSLLQETVESGTGRAAQLPGQPAFGKTGTSQEFRDAWFIGFSGPWVGGVWVGNDDGTPMNKVTGGNLPAQVWQRLMSAAIQR
ncbi:MAG: penicillin-binding transpeptidase domain-containing protein, partial [Alphaproteobacteria bacterium]|nr:penicillin-binding transpeptidase domain-containing protein [Alphaproteobacteria bacterium]